MYCQWAPTDPSRYASAATAELHAFCHGFKPVLYSRVFWSPKSGPVLVPSAIRTGCIHGCQTRGCMGNVKNQTDVMPKLQRNKADVGIDPNARSAQGRSGLSGPKASGARNWIKHKSLGSPNEKCGTCEESNDQAYKARKSEREDRGCTQTRTKVSGPEPS
ncbi:hypothetical protein GGX14DRAFT_398905 [Mycena pura]|uniref:Uncharacterized protein n=1 Tax=Mycena pura TaxID=153505 RepID=A0AAD6Y980_9AGAR|nr:hypothetical protein GGX14DRAFT_398905 [Mycena pura]